MWKSTVFYHCEKNIKVFPSLIFFVKCDVTSAFEHKELIVKVTIRNIYIDKVIGIIIYWSSFK